MKIQTLNNDSLEIVRFCDKKNINVIGGFDKLLNHIINVLDPSSVVVNTDIRWSGIEPKNTIYYKNNFKFIKKNPPNFWYIDTKLYLNRINRTLIKKNIDIGKKDDNKTEWDFMKENNFDRIWDCGSLRFELVLKNPTL